MVKWSGHSGSFYNVLKYGLVEAIASWAASMGAMLRGSLLRGGRQYFLVASLVPRFASVKFG